MYLSMEVQLSYTYVCQQEIFIIIKYPRDELTFRNKYFDYFSLFPHSQGLSAPRLLSRFFPSYNMRIHRDSSTSTSLLLNNNKVNPHYSMGKDQKTTIEKYSWFRSACEEMKNIRIIMSMIFHSRMIVKFSRILSSINFQV